MASDQGDGGGGVAGPAPDVSEGSEVADDPEAPQRLPRGAMRRWAWDVFRTTAVLVVSFLVVKAWVAEIYVVRGRSMAPTFEGGEWVLINKLVGSVVSLDRGDIVVYRRQPAGRTYVIKRILGMAGDRVEVRGDDLVLNGESMGRAYLGSDGIMSRVLVEGQVYVVGDARMNSKDSRQLGPVAVDDVVGTAVLVLWPPSRMKVP